MKTLWLATRMYETLSVVLSGASLGQPGKEFEATVRLPQNVTGCCFIFDSEDEAQKEAKKCPGAVVVKIETIDP